LSGFDIKNYLQNLIVPSNNIYFSTPFAKDDITKGVSKINLNHFKSFENPTLKKSNNCKNYIINIEVVVKISHQRLQSVVKHIIKPLILLLF
jgi:hypothetical protein